MLQKKEKINFKHSSLLLDSVNLGYWLLPNSPRLRATKVIEDYSTIPRNGPKASDLYRRTSQAW